MDLVKIQSLIREGKIVGLADVEPTETYLQIGVYQYNNRKIGSGDANTYAPYVIPLSELGGVTWGTITGLLSNQLDLQAALDDKYDVSNPAGYLTSVDVSPLKTTITVDVDLDTISTQALATLPPGLFIIEKAYISQATVDLSSLPVSELVISNSGIVVPAPWNTTATSLFTTLDPGPCVPPGCIDILNNLSLPQMYGELYAITPSCFPPPCGPFIVNGGETINGQLSVAAGVTATAKLHIVVRNIE